MIPNVTNTRKTPRIFVGVPATIEYLLGRRQVPPSLPVKCGARYTPSMVTSQSQFGISIRNLLQFRHWDGCGRRKRDATDGEPSGLFAGGGGLHPPGLGGAAGGGSWGPP